MKVCKYADITVDVSNKIANACVICALLVVVIHVPWPHDSIGMGWYVFHGVVKGIASAAVPIFFAISGFLLAGKFGSDGWWRREVNKRIHSLVVPFFIWSLICFAAVVPISVMADITANRPFGSSIPFSHGRWIQMFGFDMCNLTGLAPLWYVRNLFLLVLCSPLIKFLVERAGVLYLLILFIANFVHFTALQNGYADNWLLMFFTFGFSIEGLLYFSIGIFQRSNLAIACDSRLLYGSIGLGFVTLFGKLLLLSHGRGGGLCAALSTPFLTLAVFGMVPTKGWPSWLKESAFPLFLIHCIVLKYIGLLYKLVLASFMISCLCYVVACVTCILMSVLLRRYCPAASKVLFAGR